MSHAMSHATSGRLVVLRHAETGWSRAGRHTGRTDVPLTAEGEQHARGAAARLAAIAPRPALVLCSPLVRARRTAELAGLDAETDADLVEWDYGDYEGRTTADIQRDLDDPTWSVWTTGTGLGESLDDVVARARRVLARSAPVLASGGDVVLVAHAHLLRVLTAVHLDLPPAAARGLVLPPSSIGVLGDDRGAPALFGWGL